MDRRTAALAAALPKTPTGAVELLANLSHDYGGPDTYADGLFVLREDLRHPELRARGKAWGAELAWLVGECFAGVREAPASIGALMISQWQGSLL